MDDSNLFNSTDPVITPNTQDDTVDNSNSNPTTEDSRVDTEINDQTSSTESETVDTEGNIAIDNKGLDPQKDLDVKVDNNSQTLNSDTDSDTPISSDQIEIQNESSTTSPDSTVTDSYGSATVQNPISNNADMDISSNSSNPFISSSENISETPNIGNPIKTNQDSSNDGKRPILVGVIAAFMLLGGIFSMFISTSFLYAKDIGFFAMFFVSGIVDIVSAVGLLKMKRWGVIIFFALSIASLIFIIYTAYLEYSIVGINYISIIELLIYILAFFYLFKNIHKFR